MIRDQIQKDIFTALKAKNKLELKALRFILSQIKYAEIDKQKSLVDEEVISLLQKEIKKRKEAIEMFKKGKRQDLVKEEEDMVKIIERYLPPELSDEELEKIIMAELGSNQYDNPGIVIGKVMTKVKGRASGGRVAALVTKKIKIK